MNLETHSNINMPLSSISKKIVNIELVQNEATSQWGLLAALMNYGMFREVPHTFKRYFPTYMDQFNVYCDDDGTTNRKYVFNDVVYYEDLCTQGLTVKEDTSTFRLIHLNGMHEPFTLSSEVKRDQNSTMYAQLEGCMKILEKYFDELKEKGVYDQTQIMVLGDHGGIMGNQPALLYKPISSRGALLTTNVAVEYGDLHQTLLNAVGLEVAYGQNITEVTDEDRRRMYYSYRITDSAEPGYFPNMWEAYYENDNARIHFTGYVYTAGQKQWCTELAPVVTLGEAVVTEQMRPYFNSNFLSWGSDEYIWSMGMENLMVFKLKQVPVNGVDVELRFIEWVDSASKPLKITTIEGVLIYQGEYQMDKEPVICFHIPAESFDQEGAIALRFEWVSDSGHMTPSSTDLRKKQLGLKSFVIKKRE